MFIKFIPVNKGAAKVGTTMAIMAKFNQLTDLIYCEVEISNFPILCLLKKIL